MATINFKKSIADPIARDIGNQVIQGRIVSKTIQFSMFTTNENAAWAGKNQLQKESYPFATVSFPVNRNQFKLEVGDVFKMNNSKYGIVNMVLRVLLIEEESLESEKITLHCMEDIFSVAKAITEYDNPTDHATQPPDYTPIPFTEQDVIEAPYVLSETIKAIPFAKREAATDLGMQVHTSVDGSSYNKVDTVNNIQAYGELTVAYDIGDTIDTTIGLQIDFPTTDIDNFETISFADALAGETNMILVGDEIMTFQTITPTGGTGYALTNVIRGRYGTDQEDHLIGAKVWLATKNIGMVSDSGFLPQAQRDFKLLPYNQKFVGAIADATPINYTFTGKALTPFKPINFVCNDVSFASRYTSDCVLEWSPRKRGEGAGIGTPGVVLAETDREGFFEIEVWVSAALVRTTTAIDDVTWTYTSAMNITDNGSLASEITFKIKNYRSESGYTYSSNQAEVITKLTT